MSHGDPATLSVPELAARCGVDESTAYRYLRDGKLPGVRAGSSWIIDRARVERYLSGAEDAAGRPLIHAPPASAAPALTLLPERPADEAELARAWLRGAHAALGHLLEAALGSAEQPPAERQRGA